MFVRRALASLALALTMAACAKPAEQTAAAPAAVDTAAAKSGAADLWQRWIAADTAGNAQALAAMVDDSARIDARGMPPILGRAAWLAAAEAAFKSAKYTSMTVSPVMTMPISNELVYEFGDYTEGSTMGGKNLMDYGRYATAIVKGADGQWRFGYVMAFADSTVTVKK
ncbi:MAG TPA: DUF4440 domain-containing protein [Gemmatimonadales bacterium]|nr:DUF4440 domain-containing protein [Gemmatimonadales bacterium]